MGLILDDSELNLNQLEREEKEEGKEKHRGAKLRRERARVTGISANIGLTPIKMGPSGSTLRKSHNKEQ